ncbi:uncharacterized protein SAPINGB_P000748 [Magnusiomyces paraingens]|uniref:Isochorismatase-like domain-containing protein n=1 Tax=Magnusiomyces paraingens TaxID=2606893 RepID=A0A5E8B9F2_9ASCO|nr:uncharacterized protein SAPINGB_P000748 [Saprochaete ingens]VVT45432.1 unnamed protein product [Saprochaete ingens]
MSLRPAIFICDIQERFRPAIFGFDEVVRTSRRVLEAARILGLPVYVTTQNKKGLGDTVAELQPLISQAVVDADKSKFSMYVPEIAEKLPKGLPVAIVGIESHVCVLQTVKDLRANGHDVYVLADGVSSVNRLEKPIALRRAAALGAHVSTSESFIYEVMQDASIPEFKQIIKLVKAEKTNVQEALEKLVYHI